MNKAWLAVIPFFVALVSGFSQGTVNFANGAAGVNAPLTSICVLPITPRGAGFLAQLYAGPAGITDMNLLTTNGVSGTPQPFATGGSCGYFFGGYRDIEGYTPGSTVTLQVRAWALTSGGSWETAGWERWYSNLVLVTLGGGLTIPIPNMIGLQGWGTLIPEPSSVALAALGIVMTVIFGVRRRT